MKRPLDIPRFALLHLLETPVNDKPYSAMLCVFGCFALVFLTVYCLDWSQWGTYGGEPKSE